MAEDKNTGKRSGPYGKAIMKQVFNYDWILKNLTFFLFLAVLAVVYIANGHVADNRIRKINETGRELKELQYEYKTVKSEMMFKSRESEMVKASESMGLMMDSIPPMRIKAVSRIGDKNN